MSCVAEPTTTKCPSCGSVVPLAATTRNRLASAAIGGTGLGAAGAKIGSNIGKAFGIVGRGKGWNGEFIGGLIGGAGGTLVGGIGGLLSADFAATYVVCPSGFCQESFRIQA